MASQSQSKVPQTSFANESGVQMIDTTFNVSGGGRVVIGGGGTDRRGGGGDDGDRVALDSLPYARGAEFNAYERHDEALPHNALCHAGTRVALLQDIMAWTAAHDARHVFWLNGLAGTGKSTIARTVARRCADEKRLGASFFFTRGGGDLASARKFVTTVAVQLAAAVPATRPHIAKAAGAVRDVAALALQDQWAQLVLEPLAKASGGLERLLRFRKPIVIVVDALDGCDRDSEVAAVLGLLKLGAQAKKSWLRVLLTSRPETPIRYGIQNVPSTSLARFVLHEIEPPLVDRDISIYLTDNLRRIGTTFLRDPDWPGMDVVDRLVKQADGLFIWAATACRFIHAGGAFAGDRLLDVFNGASDESAPEKSLDRIYLTVLFKAVSGHSREREKAELIAAMYTVVATIAVLATPLDVRSLSHLKAIKLDEVNKALLGLHSILDIPDSTGLPIRLHHASFRDFIVDLNRCDDIRFAVDAKYQHQLLALRCLQLMAEHLHYDLCDQRAPGIHKTHVDEAEIGRRLPHSLPYACLYWVHHVQHAEEMFVDWEVVLAFLHEHLLHWFEALSYLGRTSEAARMLRALELLTDDEVHRDLHAFASDARQLVSSNVNIITHAPLQVYCSALLFAPSSNLVRQRLSHELPPWISRRPQVKTTWNMPILTLKTDQSRSEALVFSPDSRSIVSSGLRGVNFWDVATGESCGSIVSSFSVAHVAYSPDGRFLAYSGLDHIYRATFVLRDAATQAVQVKCKQGWLRYTEPELTFAPNSELLAVAHHQNGLTMLNTKTMEVTPRICDVPYDSSLSFSPDGRLLAVIHRLCIQLWDVGQRELVVDFPDRFGIQHAGLFSPVENLFAFGSSDSTVRLWHEEDHDVRSSLIGHVTAVESMAFSPDGLLLASACRKKCIVWDIRTNTSRYSLPRNVTGPSTVQLAVSPDGKLLAFRPDDKLIDIRYADTGLPYGTLHITLTCHVMLFSPDCRFFAWGEVGMINVAEVNMLRSRNISQDDSSMVTSTVFSFGRNLLVTTSLDNAIRVWDSEHQFGCLLTLRFDGLRSCALSRNGLRLALLLKSDTVEVVNIPGGERVLTCRSHSIFEAFTLSPDAQLLATVSHGNVDVHDLATASSVGRYPYNPDDFATVALSCDGKLLAVSPYSARTRIWDLRGQKLRSKLRLYGAQLMAFSPDGDSVVVSRVGRLEWWHLPSAACVKTLDTSGLFPSVGPYSHVLERLEFSGDGRLLLTERGALAVGSGTTATSPPNADVLGHFFVRDQWVNYAGRDVLWLPPRLCPPRASLRDNILAWGDSHDVVDYIEFDSSKIPPAGPLATRRQGNYAWEKPVTAEQWRWDILYLSRGHL